MLFLLWNCQIIPNDESNSHHSSIPRHKSSTSQQLKCWSWMFSRGKMTSSWANRKSRPSHEKVWGQPQRSKKQHVISKEICTLMLACVSTQIKRGIPRLLERMLRTAEFSAACASGTYIEGNERIPLKVGWCELQQPRWHITRNICFWLLLHSMAVR